MVYLIIKRVREKTITNKENIMKLTLKNDFHNTEITINAKNEKLSPEQVKKAQKHLCGMSDCCCSGDVGYRRQQDGFNGIEVEYDRMQNIIGAWVHQ